MSLEPKTPYILIVEDDRDIAAFFRNVLDMAGYRTEIAVNGNEAVDSLYKNPPDIILLDLSLPGISGVEILQILRAEKRFRRILTVVVTGYSRMADDLILEPDLVLEKPVSPTQLVELVNRLCQEDKSIEISPFGKNPQDRITGFYNRAFFTYRLKFALMNYRDNPDNLFGVILVKPLRDGSRPAEIGWEQANSFLKEIGNSIKVSVRPTDTIARFEPENFFILVENIRSASILMDVVGRIGLTLGRRFGDNLHFSISALLSDQRYNDAGRIIAAVEALSVR